MPIHRGDDDLECSTLDIYERFCLLFGEARMPSWAFIFQIGRTPIAITAAVSQICQHLRSTASHYLT